MVTATSQTGYAPVNGLQLYYEVLDAPMRESR